MNPYTYALLCICDLFTLVLSLLDVCVLSLVSIEPRLHAEVWVPALLVQLVPWFESRLAVTQYSLKNTMRGWIGRASNTDRLTQMLIAPIVASLYLFRVFLVVVILSSLCGQHPAMVCRHVAPPLLSPITQPSRTSRAA